MIFNSHNMKIVALILMGIQSYEMEEKQNIVHTLVDGTEKSSDKQTKQQQRWWKKISLKKERQRKKTLKQYNEHTYNFHGNFLIRLCMFVLPKFPFDAFLLIHFDCDIYIYV